MSASGPQRTCGSPHEMSAFWGRADAALMSTSLGPTVALAATPPILPLCAVQYFVAMHNDLSYIGSIGRDGG
jgi:hypothetical protein